MKKILLAGILMLSFGCTHLKSVSMTDVPKKRDNKISVTKDRFIFLAFNFDNNYVDQLTYELAQKCSKGKVEGLLTKHEVIVYFPLFFHKQRVTAEGYCVR